MFMREAESIGLSPNEISLKGESRVWMCGVVMGRKRPVCGGVWGGGVVVEVYCVTW